MHIRCTSHRWQIDHIHGQAIIGFQWWLASSLKSNYFYLEQMIYLSVVQAESQHMNLSSGRLSQCSSSWVWEITQTIASINLCVCLRWLFYVHIVNWLSSCLSRSCFICSNLRCSALVASSAAWAKCSIFSTYIHM